MKNILVSVVLLFLSLITVTFMGPWNTTGPENNGVSYGVESVAYAQTNGLTTPEINRASGITDTAIRLEWSKVKNATKYEVFRASSKDGKYKKIGSGKNTSYIDSYLKKDCKYYYKVRAIKGDKLSKFSESKGIKTLKATALDLKKIPKYSGEAYVQVNNNVPSFTRTQKDLSGFEYYSEMDDLGRCGTAISMVSKGLMPTEERGSIGMIKPSGWQTIRYDDLISDKYLYNRCHLIGYQLTGENANPKNLVTGTRYLNIEGMLPFENEIAACVEAGGKVLYRVTPIFEKDNLVCTGIEMEGYSVADGGNSICFHVFCYNVQPGITIDYEDGSSVANNGDCGQTAASNGTSAVKINDAKETAKQIAFTKTKPSGKAYFVLNMNTEKFHKSSCSSVSRMKDSNKRYCTASAEQIKELGYEPCGSCKPAA